MTRLGLLALPLALLAQTQPPVPQDPDKASFEGQVLNAVTNEPLRKTSLTLRMNVAVQSAKRGDGPAATTYTVTSDSMGKFTIPNIDPGDYRLIARHDGFADLTLGNTGNGKKVEPILFARADRKRDFTVKLVPYGAVAGVVLDEDGDPIRNVRVSAMAYRYTPAGRDLREVKSGTSNDLGEYRIFDLPAGRYYVKINPAQLRMFNSGPEPRESYAPVYYPGVPQAVSAIPQDLTPGQQLRNVSFNLRKVHFATIRGKVVAPADARNIQAGQLVAVEGGSTSTSTGVDDKTGKFEFANVPPGFIYLTGSYFYNNQRYDTMVPLEVAGTDIDGIELRPVPPADVTGEISVAGTPDFDMSKVSISLEGASAGHNSQGGSTIRKDGKIILPGITPGRYRVRLDRISGLYIKSIQWGTTDITDSELDLLAGVPPRTELAVVLGSDGGQLEGLVKNENGDPVDSAIVTLVPAGGHKSAPFHKRATSDASGKYTISGIAPGSYKLYAWDKVDTNAVMFDPDFLRQYEAAGQTVEVLPSGKKALELKLIVNRE